MSPETRLEFAAELNLKDDFIISFDSADAVEEQDGLQTEERRNIIEAGSVSYTLKASEAATNQLSENPASLDGGVSDSVSCIMC